MATGAVCGLSGFDLMPRALDNFSSIHNNTQEHIASSSTATLHSAASDAFPKSFDLPWDIFTAIIDNADVQALKAMSLVCRDFFIESAPALYRCFAANVKPTHDPLMSQLLMLQLQTEALKQHSHFHLIKHVHVTLDRSMTRTLGDGMKVLDHLVALFQAIGDVEQLEVLELELGSAQAIVTGCLRAIPLPASLKEIRIFSKDSFLLSLGAEFWQRHSRNLHTLAILAPPATNSMDTPAMTKSYMSLENLHLHSANLTHHLTLPPTLRSLIIEQIRGEDIDSLLLALQPPSESEPVIAPPSPRLKMVGSPKRMVAATQTRTTAASHLEEFSFGYLVGNPSRVYSALVANMPRLRKLTARHGPFPPWEVMNACAVLRGLSELEELEWTVEGGALVDESLLSGVGNWPGYVF